MRVDVQVNLAGPDNPDLTPLRVLDHANVIQSSRHDVSLSCVHPARPPVEITEDDDRIALVVPIVNLGTESLQTVSAERLSLWPIDRPMCIQDDDRRKPATALAPQDLRDNESPRGELR